MRHLTKSEVANVGDRIDMLGRNNAPKELAETALRDVATFMAETHVEKVTLDFLLLFAYSAGQQSMKRRR